MSPVTTMSTVTSSDAEGIRLIERVEAVYNRLGLREDQAQRLNEDPLFATELAALMEKCSQPDDRFELLTTFEVTVPTDYNHDNHLTTFGKMNRTKFYFYAEAITDANFSKTPALVPGKKFLVKAFQVKGVVSSDDCLIQLKRVKATLTSAQGASLVYAQAKDKLSVNRWSFFFDEKNNLPFIDDYHMVQRVSRSYNGGVFRFDLGHFEKPLDGSCVLLAFCDLPAGEVETLDT